MATYVFENMTQAQANAITGADIIAIATTTVSAGSIGVSISASTDTIQNTTLTVGSKSLFFDAVALKAISAAGNIVFNDGSSLALGVNTADTDASLPGASYAYLFSGNDTYTAAAGGSFVFGMGGADSLIGGAGADHLYGFNASGGTDGTDTLAGGDGNDYLQGNAGADALDGGEGSDRIQGGAGNDTIADTGVVGNDTINGNTGDDTINGGAGNDSLRGGQGNDSVSGAADDDFVLGDLGNDTLNGGAGVDALTGGAGNDVFTFSTGDATPVSITVSGTTTTYYDTVLDYTDGLDTFRIAATGGASTIGDDATGAEIVRGAAGATFTTVSAATDYAQQLLDANTGFQDVAIVKVGSDTYLFFDKDAATGVIDSIIKLQGVTDTSLLTATDFAG